jgi:hypothetical protein
LPLWGFSFFIFGVLTATKCLLKNSAFCFAVDASFPWSWSGAFLVSAWDHLPQNGIRSDVLSQHPLCSPGRADILSVVLVLPPRWLQSVPFGPLQILCWPPHQVLCWPLLLAVATLYFCIKFVPCLAQFFQFNAPENFVVFKCSSGNALFGRLDEVFDQGPIVFVGVPSHPCLRQIVLEFLPVAFLKFHLSSRVCLGAEVGFVGMSIIIVCPSLTGSQDYLVFSRRPGLKNNCHFLQVFSVKVFK